MKMIEIIEQYRQTGDKLLYKDIVDFFIPSLKGALRNFNEKDKNDLLHYSLTVIPQALNAWDSNKGNVVVYVCQYCKGMCNNKLKKDNKAFPMEQKDIDNYIDNNITHIDINLKAEIEQMLVDNLTPIEIKIIKMHYGFFGKAYTFAEIENTLNIKSVFYRNRQALEKLRKSNYIKDNYSGCL